jgi:hypothetical protein
MYFPRNWEFGSALSELRNFGEGGGVEPPKLSHSVRHWVQITVSCNFSNCAGGRAQGMITHA